MNEWILILTSLQFQLRHIASLLHLLRLQQQHETVALYTCFYVFIYLISGSAVTDACQSTFLKPFHEI